MQQLLVDLGNNSYPIFIGSNLLSAFNSSELIKPYVHGTQVLIVTNQTVAPLYLSVTKRLFKSFTVAAIILPDGEQYKNLTTLNLIFDKLLQLKFDRQCTLVALGGGVIGDICGFAAAIYQRGVNFIQIPTTLLAQVDSSVGGKTGVNHPLGKNMLGSFYQPKCVIADLTTLKTLEARQIAAGCAEIIKYGLINDAGFFVWLEQNIYQLLQLDISALSHAVFESCANKARIVALDEKEMGVRATLNLGHTFGHAIEASLGYGEWLHGEAVGLGMIMAADLSKRLGMLSTQEVSRTIKLINAANLPTNRPTSITTEQYLSYMQLDKKVIAGKIKLILLTAIGSATITDDFDHSQLIATLESSY